MPGDEDEENGNGAQAPRMPIWQIAGDAPDVEPEADARGRVCSVPEHARPCAPSRSPPRRRSDTATFSNDCFGLRPAAPRRRRRLHRPVQPHAGAFDLTHEVQHTDATAMTSENFPAL